MDARMKALDDADWWWIWCWLRTRLRSSAPSGVAQRERFLRYVLARYDAFNVDWEIAGSFEGAAGGRNIIRELGVALRRYDPYNHPAVAARRLLRRRCWATSGCRT